MLDFLEPLKDEDHDIIKFLPNKRMDEVNIESGHYIESGELVGGSKIGHRYHINIFKKLPDGKFTADSFDAILICPLEYISNLIKNGWYGAVLKKTTSSDEINNEIKSSMIKILEKSGVKHDFS